VTDTALAVAHRLLERAADAVSSITMSGNDDELISLLVLCEGASRRLDGAVVDAVAALERRGVFAEKGYKSAAGALGDLLGWERFEARRRGRGRRAGHRPGRPGRRRAAGAAAGDRGGVRRRVRRGQTLRSFRRRRDVRHPHAPRGACPGILRFFGLYDHYASATPPTDAPPSSTHPCTPGAPPPGGSAVATLAPRGTPVDSIAFGHSIGTQVRQFEFTVTDDRLATATCLPMQVNPFLRVDDADSAELEPQRISAEAR
jgi:hypothetical protein